MINTVDFTQRYFPPEMAVDFSIIPEDELPALVEGVGAAADRPRSALGDARIDLDPAVGTGPAQRMAGGEYRLTTRTRTLRPAAINLVATRKPPLEILQQLRIRGCRCRSSRATLHRRVGAGIRGAAQPVVRTPQPRLPRRPRRRGDPRRGSRHADTAAPRLAALASIQPPAGCSSGPPCVPRWKCRACWPARLCGVADSPRRWRWRRPGRYARPGGGAARGRRSVCAWRARV